MVSAVSSPYDGGEGGTLDRPRPTCTPAHAPQAQPWFAPGSLPRLQLIEQQWHEGGPREGRAAAGFLLSRDDLCSFLPHKVGGGFGLALKCTWLLVGRTVTRTEVGNRVAKPDRTAPPAASVRVGGQGAQLVSSLLGPKALSLQLR